MSYLTITALLFNQLMVPSLVLAQEATPSASIEAKPSPQPTPSPTPSPSPSPEQEATPSAVTTPQSGKLNSQSTASSSATPSPNPSPNPQPQPTPALSFWNINADGSTTTINPVSLGVTYKAPQNDKVSLTFTKLPENAGTVTVKEHEAPPTVENAGSKDYEITSSMPNGSFEFDLTLPTNDPNKTVLSSQDGQNYTPITNEKITTADTITIKGITHLTHFIVGTEDEDEFDHPLINEFMPHPSSGNDWIELYNPTNHKISLVGWKLNDINVTPMRNLTGTILAKGFAVFEVSDRLNNGGDSIFLNDPRGTTFDSRSYNLDPGIDKSIGRTPNGGPTWTTFNTATKGVSNGASLDTLYVDANWFDSDNDGGHNWGFDAFSRIQDAINFAPAGATINVAAGQFSENLIINKSLALLGPGLEATQSAKIIMPGNGEEDTCDRLVSIDEANNVTVQGFFMDGGRCGSPVIWVDQSLGSKLLANDITGGSNGIELTSSSSKTTISGNNIHANDSGIIVQRAATNLARSNSIFGNEIGVDNQDTTARFDASSNWWGQASGPTHTTNSSGTGDSISGNVKYRPFYTDAARTTLSSTTIGAGNFSPAPFFLSGIFSLPSGTTSQTNTPSVTINQETIFTAVAGLGISSVKLPFGVVIQRVGGGTLNASLLKIENALPASLTGFASGATVDGSLQWGIPNLGLEFKDASGNLQPITLSISVDASLNGKTLNVVRSVTGTGGWVSEGIVSPGTCDVANGLCTFQATKASFYATTHTVSSSSSSVGVNGGGDGLGCAVHDCSGVHPAPQNPVLGVSTPGAAAGFAPGVLAVSTPQGNVGVGENKEQVKGESTTPTSPPSATTPPQNAGSSPVNVKAIAIVVIILLLGFGVFRLLIK